MFNFLVKIFLLVVVIVGGYAVYNSGRTFEAKFKNIDGLPIGAPVTALGVKVGTVIRTKPVEEGILVVVRITNKSFPLPPAGSQLAITSLRPGQGRVLEVIPPDEDLDETHAWLIREPITTESWLDASLELYEGLKGLSNYITRQVTSENVSKLRSSISSVSNILDSLADKMKNYQWTLVDVTQGLAWRANEANQLVVNLKSSVDSLNSVFSDKELGNLIKNNLSGYTDKINTISETLSKKEFLSMVDDFKVKILDNLNEIRLQVNMASEGLDKTNLKHKLKLFNEHVDNLNTFYEKLNKSPVSQIAKDSLHKARELTTKASETTSQLIKEEK